MTISNWKARVCDCSLLLEEVYCYFMMSQVSSLLLEEVYCYFMMSQVKSVSHAKPS